MCRQQLMGIFSYKPLLVHNWLTRMQTNHDDYYKWIPKTTNYSKENQKRIKIISSDTVNKRQQIEQLKRLQRKEEQELIEQKQSKKSIHKKLWSIWVELPWIVTFSWEKNNTQSKKLARAFKKRVSKLIIKSSPEKKNPTKTPRKRKDLKIKVVTYKKRSRWKSWRYWISLNNRVKWYR